MTRRRMWSLLSNLLLAAVIAAAAALVLYRTDPDRIVQEVARPYTTMAIVPDTLSQHRIAGTPQWGLFYSLKTIKSVHCDEVVVERFVHRLDEPFPIASNRDVSGETIPVSSEERITPGLHARLTQPLGAGEYFLLVRSTCYVADDDGTKLPLAPSAEAFICFSVPDAMPPHGDQRLQPVSENCRRELSNVTLRPVTRRLANGR